LLPLVLTFAAALGVAQPASTPSLYRGWNVSAFTIRGLDGRLANRLGEGLALAGERKLLRTHHPLFTPDLMQADVDRARLFLVRHGRPDATITPRLEPDARQRSVAVVFEIDPGPVVRLTEMAAEALPPHLAPQAAPILALEEDAPFTDALIEERIAALLRLLRSSGYAGASVQTEIERTDSTSARVRFLVDAGEIYYFGDTVVRGIADDLIGVARRSIDIAKGSRFSPERLATAADNLRLLDLFRQVRLVTEDAGDQQLNVIADLAERTPQSVELALGYWSVDKLQLRGAWRHRNLLGDGRGLGLEGSYARYAQTAGLRVWQPALFHSRTLGSIALQGRREDEEAYRLLSGEIEVAATFLPSLDVTIRPAIAVAVYDLVAKTDSTGAYPDPGPNLLRCALKWSENRLNDRLYPTSGTLLQVFTETGLPDFGFQRNYTLVEPEAILYIPLLGEALTCAGRTRLGYAFPAGHARELLPDKRFYAGGPNSMRGYLRRQLGPRDAEGRSIGGTSKLEASVELRFPIIWRFHGAVFCDAGQVWDARDEIRPFDLKLAAGPGLLVQTPVGPVRVDVGFPITVVPDSEPEVVFHLSVGQAY